MFLAIRYNFLGSGAGEGWALAFGVRRHAQMPVITASVEHASSSTRRPRGPKMMGTAQMSGAPPIPEILPAGAITAHGTKPEVVAREPLERALAMPCTLTLEVPVVSFTVGAMLTLEVGSVVETAAQQNEDLPLTVNGQLVGMVEIEVVGDNLAVRLAGVA